MGSLVHQMDLKLFLNELSVDGRASHDKAVAAVDCLVHTLLELKRRRPSIAVMASEPFWSREISPGYSLRVWCDENRSANRDLVRWLTSLLQRAPHKSLAEVENDGIEYFFQDTVVEGLGWAHLTDGMALSFSIEEKWDAPFLHLKRRILGEQGDLIDDCVEARHLVRPDHIKPHLDWVTKDSFGFTSGAGVWESCGEVYPFIRFLPAVERMLRDVNPTYVRGIQQELALLNRAVGDWKPSDKDEPTWLSKVSPEHEQRRKRRLFDYIDSDGEIHTFHQHVRYTPGPGRIHFRFSSGEAKVVVAYIGRKVKG